MNFLEVATGVVLSKKLFLKISQYPQESYRPSTLLKTDSNTVFSPWILQNILKNTYFEEHLLTAASDFLKQLQNSGEQMLLYCLFY